MSQSPSHAPPARQASSGSSRGRRIDGQHRRANKGGDTTTTLACNQCRQKKVKCVLEDTGCRRCNRLGIDCAWPSEDQRKCPSSKTHIRALEERIASLEAALAEATTTIESLSAQQSAHIDLATETWAMTNIPSPIPTQDHESFTTSLPQTLAPSSLNSLPLHTEDDNIISRLCGRQWKLNSDEEGQYKFFGPTSSLHLTESVSSSLLESGCHHSMLEDTSLNSLIDHDTHLHLLELYWNYQHNILQVFDREEFLDCLNTRQGKYFSKALLYTVYACAARISDRPNLRALVVPSQDDLYESEPYLVGIATKLVDQELERPRITTIQALLLLSIINCSLSKNTKGWVATGVACSLAIDFGLHKSDRNLASAKLTSRDIRVRRNTYWGCLVFDRFWARYLGRPVSLRDDDCELEIYAPMTPDSSWDTKLAFLWVRLLRIAGNISDALNRVSCAPETLQLLDAQLQDWYSNLEPEFHYSPNAPPSIALLHMEYCSSKIHLHRPTANFGSSRSMAGAQDCSRRICVENAENIAKFVNNYRSLYGSASTMCGVGLQMIATAATILIASIAEKRATNTSLSKQMCDLQTCVRGLCEMEKTYLVARRVRRIIRLILSVCNIDVGSAPTSLHSIDRSPGSIETEEPIGMFDCSKDLSANGVDGLDFTDTAMASMAGEPGRLWTDELPAVSGYREYDIVYNLGSFL